MNLTFMLSLAFGKNSSKCVCVLPDLHLTSECLLSLHKCTLNDQQVIRTCHQTLETRHSKEGVVPCGYLGFCPPRGKGDGKFFSSSLTVFNSLFAPWTRDTTATLEILRQFLGLFKHGLRDLT